MNILTPCLDGISRSGPYLAGKLEVNRLGKRDSTVLFQMLHQYRVLRFCWIMKRTEFISSSMVCIFMVSARRANPDRIHLLTSTEEASRSFIDFLAFNLILCC
jgi:hypothetical protein